MATEYGPGEWLKNRWKITNVLEGGMGIVYILFDQERDKKVAAKTVKNSILEANPEVGQLFMREAEAWVKLGRHPNVIEANEVHLISGKPFLFLEFLPGGNLKQWIGSTSLLEDLPRVLQLSLQVCDGMNHILANGIDAHRDLKPNNCLLTDKGKTLKIGDFGLAKVSGTKLISRENPSPSGRMLFGTPSYMAPEQFDNPSDVDVRADIYAFGVMLYEMLAGHLPFSGTLDDLQRLHRTEAPTRLTKYPAQLNQIICRCLAKDREQRYATFEILRDEIANVDATFGARAPTLPASRTPLNSSDLSNQAVSLSYLGRHEEALAILQSAVQMDPGNAMIWSHLGSELGFLDRYDEELQAYERALQLEPHTSIQINIAATLNNQKRFDEALAHLDGFDPESPRGLSPAENVRLQSLYWKVKGSALHQLRRQDEALICTQKAFDLAPTELEDWETHYHVLKSLGRYEQALRYLDDILSRNANLTEVWIVKINLLLELGQFETALDAIDRLLPIDPTNLSLWSTKASVLGRLDRHEESLECSQRCTELNPAISEAWMNAAVALEKLGQPAKAIKYFDHFLTLEPQSAQAWCNKGATLKAMGKLEEAVLCYDQALEIDPRHAASSSNKAATLIELGRSEEAVACCNHALEVDPTNCRAWVNKASGMRELGRVDEALDCCNQAISISPEFAPAFAMKASILRDQKRWLEALDCYERASLLDPQEVNTWINRASLLRQLDRCQEALRCLDRAIRMAPDDPRIWSQRGLVLSTLGQRADAVNSFNRALIVDSRDTNNLANKALTLLHLGRFVEALTCCDLLLEAEPLAEDAWKMKGWALAGAQQFSAAMAWYERAASSGFGWAEDILSEYGVQTKSPVALEDGRSEEEELEKEAFRFVLAGDYESAHNCYEKILDLNPGNADAWFANGSALGMLERTEDEVNCYQACLMIQPNHKDALTNLAVVYRTVGMNEEALQIYDRLLTLFPNDEMIWTNKGVALAALHRYEAEIECCERVLHLNPYNESAWLNKACSLLDLGRSQEAVTCFARVLKINPSNEKAQAGLKKASEGQKQK